MGTLYFFGDSNMKERRGIMYEQLIEELNAHPAHGYNIEDAEKLADKILELGGYKDTLGRTPIVKIVNNFGFSAFKEQNMPKNISGNIFIGGTTKEIYHNDKVIVVGADEEFYHQRFIIAHELAHYLMDYIGNEKYADSKKLFSMAYLKDNHDKGEVRADRFAAEILMPANLFSAKYKRVSELSFHDMEYTLKYLSDYFQTKISCIKRRIDELGLDIYGYNL